MASLLEPKPEGAPEWMVSFADMITIMMSFFVIMFALATTKNEAHKEAAIDSIEHRFGPNWVPFGKGGGTLDTSIATQASAARGNKGIRVILPAEVKADGPRAGMANIPAEGNLAGIGGAVYFDELSDQLSRGSDAALADIAKQCVGKPQKVMILGHSSRRPLPEGSPYRDHWDLAYARCRAVADKLAPLGIGPERMRLGVAGSAEPAATRDPASAGRLNSRVDVYLLDILVTDFDRSTGSQLEPERSADNQ